MTRAKLAAATLLSVTSWLSMGCNSVAGFSDVTFDGEPISDSGGGEVAPDVPAPTTPLACSYAPDAGTLGVGETKFLPPTLSFNGYSPGSEQPGPINATAFYDCTGNKEVHAIVFETSQFG
jgi:hypothetical protein